ncbi:hypothetical protein LH935_03570 [Gordonia polyisoprenivorans]|uniref:hypothetical protein n=1 Tax=Gordonia polyisoprenivorans TaxID=84595 RepID=UPI002234DEC8|nr:hypothetical protein LH935_03570 [Gordonia polyisoprenivorans]
MTVESLIHSDPIAAIPLARLVAIIPEVVEVLRGDVAVSGPRAATSPTRTDAVIDCCDRLVAEVCAIAEDLDLDLAGIPLWRSSWGEVRGLRTATRPIHIKWIAEDIHTAAVGRRRDLSTAARLRDVLKRACRSPSVASILTAEVEEATLAVLAEDFADIREGNRAC